ncbi:MAG: glycosyltransferase [Rhodospirillaceae bacterium]|jgi:hopene-associated glycosyltransferase HpnB|nr:glycosyltransferase [Rhodospirillaceae bacterium]MBT7486882.1 glycosyltransferase [Rhodospirillales bacterium]MBT4699648.1 glycosyltransferase [Rhodospirillaceae bacterium]MBT5034259.1 glycosyltransferase [Rhodospirillaceae bacterium]MBT6218168.1 glycosyltransferase [Rhodospirillaceae bacterium]
MIQRLLPFLPFAIWIGLILFRGNFWRSDQITSGEAKDLDSWPNVTAVIPARNEAPSIGATVETLLAQDYPGSLSVVVVDDNSDDGTADVARAAAGDRADKLTVVSGKPLEAGWSGKLWAVSQGIEGATTSDYIWLTDADITHTPGNLRWLVAKAEVEKLDLVSEMVMLRCESFWERLLIPAFIFFFQKLYPFPQVNNPDHAVAAAAGGCVLVKRKALADAGGIAAIKDKLIDDCALAAIIKARGPIWLGLTERAHSLRVYNHLSEIWHMVARTAFVQLDHSVLQLIGTVVGMAIIYLAAPIMAIWSGITGDELLGLAGGGAWLVMAITFLPTLRLYKMNPAWAMALPLAGLIYTAMTVDSARQHWAGRGGAWKGRSYSS